MQTYIYMIDIACIFVEVFRGIYLNQHRSEHRKITKCKNKYRQTRSYLHILFSFLCNGTIFFPTFYFPL